MGRGDKVEQLIDRYARLVAGRARSGGPGQPRAVLVGTTQLAQVAPRFAPAMQDSSRFGMAKTLTAAMVDDGVAIDEDPIVLPPVSLASEDELRRAAAAAPLVVRVGALLSHLGPEGRPTTQTGALRLVDAKVLAEVCGDEERLLRPKHWEGQVRRMADRRWSVGL